MEQGSEWKKPKNVARLGEAGFQPLERERKNSINLRRL